MRRFILLFCLLAATACDEKTPVGPSVPLNQQFTLAPGEAAVLGDTGLSVQFVGVAGDSRCPADAFCVWAGDAILQMRLVDSGVVTTGELHTGDSNHASVTHRDVRVTLVHLLPYPYSNRTIQPGDYRATLEAKR
jgi:hypothetical protein